MAEVDYKPCFDRLIIHEGTRYTDGVHPYDPGGPTKFGVTIFDMRRFIDPKATPADVERMTIDVPVRIYKPKYWDALNCDLLEPGVDDSVFDYGVNSGIARSGKVLRRVLGLNDSDWHVTKDVILAAGKRDPTALVDAINDERLRFLHTLKIWPTYGAGWSTRVKEVREVDMQLAKGFVAAAVELPAPSQEVQIAAKGMVTPPTTAKTALIAAPGGPAIAAATHPTLHNWIAGHQLLTATMVIGAVGVVSAGIAILESRHRAQQEAPTAGTTVVPLRSAA